MNESMACIPLAEAIRICEALYPIVPWPNQWQGSEREQLIFGKGMVAGAKACAEALTQRAPVSPDGACPGPRSGAGTEGTP